MLARVITLLAVVFCLVFIIEAAPAKNRERGRGNEGGNANRCKYRKGQWGECSATTSKRTRTDTLMTELSPSTCNATRTFEKPCKRKTCEFGPWGEYGQCENNRQTKTRPILSGTVQECGEKAKKIKTCRRANTGRANTGQRGNAGRRRGGNADTDASDHADT